MPPALPCLTLVEVAGLLKGRQLTSTELTKTVLAHIAALDPTLHAFATLTPESALQAAQQADAEIAAAGTTRGPLHGVPIAVKDLYAVAGVPNAAGSKALLDHLPLPTDDCTVVARLKAAGAVLLGKLNTTEGAMGGYNEV